MMSISISLLVEKIEGIAFYLVIITYLLRFPCGLKNLTIVLCEHNYVYSLAILPPGGLHAQQAAHRRQARYFAPAGDLQSTSRDGHSSTVSGQGQRFFRCPRFAPGEVRDVTFRRRGKGFRDPSRSCLWFFSPIVLPGPGSSPTGRPRRVDPAEARPPHSPQAHHQDHGI